MERSIPIYHRLVAAKYAIGRLRYISTSEYVAARFRDPNFDLLTRQYKWLYKVLPIQNLIITNPLAPSLPLDFLRRLNCRPKFLHKFPHIFTVFHHQQKNQLHCSLTQSSLTLFNEEAKAIRDSLPVAVDRLIRVISMSVTKSVPLSVIDEVYRELGMPEDYEVEVILRNPDVFLVEGGMLKLVEGGRNVRSGGLVASVEDWRVVEYCRGHADSDMIKFCFRHGFPKEVKLTEDYKRKVKEWQRLKYVGPYEGEGAWEGAGIMEMEKRAVGILHEFLSLTVEKMVEVERISQFREWFGFDFNIGGLCMNHPGIFYLATNKCRHTVFLREAYERGRLIDSNPVYEVRRKLLDLVLLGLKKIDDKLRARGMMELEKGESIASESKLEMLKSDQTDKADRKR